MQSNSDSDLLEGQAPKQQGHKKLSLCLLTRIAFYGCLALALITLGVFIVTNLKSG